MGQSRETLSSISLIEWGIFVPRAGAELCSSWAGQISLDFYLPLTCFSKPSRCPEHSDRFRVGSGMGSFRSRSF